MPLISNYMEGGGSVVKRKGAWSEEEDLLLRKCIEKYGEGKWHQVPLKAGLNRCRKSCRLRWLNYLHPNIKRGEFTTDEVDLIIRMHKLLGNRWSLIAGRLPGRTANDIKNYCNTHFKNMVSSRHNKEVIRPSVKKYHPQYLYQMTSNSKGLEPLSRTFSKNFKWSKAAVGITSTTSSIVAAATNIISTQKCTNNKVMPAAAAAIDSSFDQLSSESNKLTPLRFQSILQLEADDDHQAENDGTGNNGDHNSDEIEATNNQENDYWNDLYLDDNLWRLFNGEQMIL